MERLSIEELIAHCNRSLDGLPSGCKLYQEHESTQAYLQILRHFINASTGYVGELMKLIRENPDLPIVPMVDSEIVGDDGYNRWIGSWGSSYIDEYWIGESRVHYRDDSDDEAIEKALCDRPGCYYEEIEGMTDEEWKQAYANIPWIKAIIVNIDLPD